VIKTYPADGDGPASFATEAAGLAVTVGTGLAPNLLSVDSDTRTVVMSDFGAGRSLADLLLGSSAQPAQETLLAWARYCGELSVAVRDRRADFDTLLAGYLAGRPEESYAAGLPDRILRAGRIAGRQPDELGDLGIVGGVQAPAGLADELREVADAVRPDRYPVFSPGDICPDNNLIAGGRLRFLDFENAGFHCAFLNAAYIRMPFGTCWCVFRLPDGISHAAETIYRRQVAQVHPRLADDATWQPGLRRAVAAWTLSAMTWLLPWAARADQPMDPDQVSPGNRQLMRYRWRMLADELDSAGELPALAQFANSLLTATDSWEAAALPLYPAFR
jgi:hypothetical protein